MKASTSSPSGNFEATVASLADRAEHKRSSLHPNASIHDIAMVAVVERYDEINGDSARVYAAVVSELFQREKLVTFQNRGGSFISHSHDAQAECEERNERNFNQ